MKKRAISFILIFAVVFSVFVTFHARKAYSLSKEEIINSAVLTPMKTGYTPTDETVERIFGEIFTEGMSTYDKVKACYDEVIYDTEYKATFDSRMVPVVQRDYGFIAYRDAYIALRANTFLTGRKGVCNDYSCAFVALTRAIGLQSYIVTGKTNTTSGKYAGHMWVNILINGVYYTFDPQVECNIMLRRDDKKIIYSRFCVTDEDMKGRLILDNRQYDISLFNDFRKYGEEDVTYPTVIPTDAPASTHFTESVTESETVTTYPAITPTTEHHHHIVRPEFTEDLGVITVSEKGRMRLGKDIIFTVKGRPADEVLVMLIDGIGDEADMSYVRYPDCRYDTENNMIIWTPRETGSYTVICYTNDGKGQPVQACHYEYDFIEECTVVIDGDYMTVKPEKTPVSKIKPFDEYVHAVFTDGSGKEIEPGMTLRTGYRYISEEKEYSVYIKGDTDGDGSVSTTDYILIKRSMLGIHILQNEYFKAADTDGDVKLTSTDFILVKRHILGISDLYEEKLPPLYEATTDTISDSAVTTEASTETTAASEITIASAPTGTESAETTSECTAAEPTETFAVKG